MIMKVYLKPEACEAIFWKGDNLKELIEFTGKAPLFDEWFSSFEEYERRVREDGYIFKLFSEQEGAAPSKAHIGDYIVKSRGHTFVCSKEDFNNYFGIIGVSDE